MPQYLVTVTTDNASAAQTLETVEQILANRVHDLEVWVAPRPADPAHEWLVRQLDPDPRVRFGDHAAAVAAVPGAAFHVSIPAGARLREYAIGNLRTELGDHAHASAELANGAVVSIARSWLVARARRADVETSTIASAHELSWKDLGIRSDKAPGGRNPLRRLRDPESRVGRVLRQLQRVRTPAQAWRFVRWMGGAVRQQVGGRAALPAPTLSSAAVDTSAPAATYPLGVEIGTSGPRAAAVFAASHRVGPLADERVDVVVADESIDSDVPVVVLDEGAPMLSVPAFDPRSVNPVRWVRAHDGTVATLGQPSLVPGTPSATQVDASNLDKLRVVHHLVDVGAHHATCRTPGGCAGGAGRSGRRGPLGRPRSDPVGASRT